MTWLFVSKRFIIHALALVAALCATLPSNAARAAGISARGQVGFASWHAPTGRGCRTASRRRWVNTEMIAAHRTLPMGTRVRVVNLANGHEAVVQITDRGPYHHGRIIDVSRVAAQQLGLIHSGTARVRVETMPVEPPPGPKKTLFAFREGPLLD